MIVVGGFAAIRTQWQQRKRADRSGPTQMTPTEDNSFRARQGILVKRGEIRRTWLARFFKLDESGITYSAHQSDSNVFNN